MFTGMIERMGKIKQVKPNAKGIQFSIAYRNATDPIGAGESVAVNGVCLTVERSSGMDFTVQAVNETLSRTTLGKMGLGDVPNLERSLKVGDRMGGHFVFGHIDGVGTIEEVTRTAEMFLLSISFPANCEPCAVERGSVAVDGVSLTIQQLGRGSFSVAVVPYTAEVTNLSKKKVDDLVNIEVDMLAKYVQKGGRPSLTEQGF